MKEYEELVEARDWCAKNGFSGFQQYYNEMIGFQAKRRALPIGIQREMEDDEEPERRGRR